MATLTSSAPTSGLPVLTAPFRRLLGAVDMLRAAQRASHLADTLYHASDDALTARGLKRADVSGLILSELERR